jgi:FkbM family methyltransferase
VGGRRVLDYAKIFARFGISPQGVLHIGGFVGSEDKVYRRIGFRHRLFVEAQPDTFAQLRTNLGDRGAVCENVAVSDRIGTARFHVLANGQSSSLLAPLRHLDVYPRIGKVAEIEVPTTTVDELVSRDAYRGMAFNFINLDIQGAELLALMGAKATLPAIDIINAEINFDELYEGAPHVRDLDGFLWDQGFLRVDTVSAHATWGDAIYVKAALTKARRA